LVASGQIPMQIVFSMKRALAGYFLAAAVFIPLGIVMGLYRPAHRLLEVIIEMLRPVPPPVIIPVAMLIFGLGDEMKIFVIFFSCAWPILLNTISAVRNVDPTLLRLARSMDLSAPRLFQKVILPASVPTIFTGIRLAGAVSILVLVAAEMIGAKAGLGYLINATQYNFEIPQMYAGIITISAIGVAFNQLLVAVERRLSSWRVPTGS